jgi:hypothetical protein
MPVEKIAALGWENCARLWNDQVELLATLDVGPRLLRFALHDGDNVLRVFPDQLGTRGETEFVARGGHRLWISPETEQTYAPDNRPVECECKAPDALHLTNSPDPRWRVRKEMMISLAAKSSAATIQHRLTNEGGDRISIASWGLTVMAPGGIEIIPQPALGTHGEEFLPNRVIVPWTYTDFSDDRWRLGRRFFFLEPKSGRPATKLGLAHRERWVAYVLPRVLFVKTFDFEESASYPDLGCNFETFSKDDFIELETLSPLKDLAPGESVGHTERWQLFPIDEIPPLGDETALERWFAPFISKLESTR